MALSISVVVLLTVIVWLLISKGGLKGGHATACVLFGFYLASSSLAPTIREITSNIAHLLASLDI